MTEPHVEHRTAAAVAPVGYAELEIAAPLAHALAAGRKAAGAAR